MVITPDIIERLLVGLCRFLIEAADIAREDAPMRTPEVAAYGLACANAAGETLRHAIATRDREKARNPLQEVAARLGIILDLAFLPACGRIAELGLKDVVARHGLEAGIDVPLFATAHTVHCRLHIIVDAPSRHAAEDTESVPLGVE